MRTAIVISRCFSELGWGKRKEHKLNTSIYFRASNAAFSQTLHPAFFSRPVISSKTNAASYTCSVPSRVIFNISSRICILLARSTHQLIKIARTVHNILQFTVKEGLNHDLKMLGPTKRLRNKEWIDFCLETVQQPGLYTWAPASDTAVFVLYSSQQKFMSAHQSCRLYSHADTTTGRRVQWKVITVTVHTLLSFYTMIRPKSYTTTAEKSNILFSTNYLWKDFRANKSWTNIGLMMV